MLSAAVAGLALSAVPAAADDFSPATVFQPAYRQAIDSRCPDARKDADAIGADPMTVPLATVADSYKTFLACARLSRLPAASDRTTYAELAAATSAYLIAIRTSGQQAQQGLTFAKQIDEQIVPPPQPGSGSVYGDSADMEVSADDPNAGNWAIDPRALKKLAVSLHGAIVAHQSAGSGAPAAVTLKAGVS